MKYEIYIECRSKNIPRRQETPLNRRLVYDYKCIDDALENVVAITGLSNEVTQITITREDHSYED